VLNCDDFVLKGVYHNGCMTKCLLKNSPKNEQKQDSDLSSYEIAFQNLIHEINDGCNFMYFKIFLECFILTNETNIPLNGLVLGACYNTCYKAYLPADTGTYSSAKLQDRLVEHYAGSVVMHTQRGQGMSNLVFSDKLS
jgi:hypothetical protein